MITQAEKNGIKRILQDPMWGSIQRVADEMMRSIAESLINKETQWDTAKGAVERDAKIQGIREFIGELYKQAA